MSGELQVLPELAERINAEHDRCQESAQDTIAHAFEVGRLLVKAKDQVPHGQWAGWVAENCSFEMRQAQNYMRIYRNRTALEAQMSNGVADLDSIRGAVAALAEPKFAIGDPWDKIVVNLTTVLESVQAEGWPQTEHWDEALAHCREISRLAHQIYMFCGEYKVRCERAMGELLMEMEAAGGK
jgi:hypothetical protein